MRIKIREGAAGHYIQRCYKGAPGACGQLHNPKYADMLRKVEGQWLDVETDHLFRDQFNTAPIPDVSESGLRVMIESVGAIENDARLGVVKCHWCGGYDHNKDGICDKCERSDYLKPLYPITV